VLHSPVTLNLLGSGGPDGGLAAGSGSATEIEHFLYDCAPADRLLACMAMLKLGLVKKKALIFVNTVDRVRARHLHGSCMGAAWKLCVGLAGGHIDAGIC
jgi:superfamily II DNA/RNA helicase